MSVKPSNNRAIKTPPPALQRLGLVLERGDPGAFDCHVLGDPCIVWDEEIGRYRMFYFAQRRVGGEEENAIGQAIATSEGESIPSSWEKVGAVAYANPEAFNTDWGTHKPWILTDANHPNRPVRIDGQYWLISSTFQDKMKVIHVARSPSLAGPWTVQEQPVIERGDISEPDGRHADTPTAFWFEDRGEILFFYMAFPAKPQAEQPHSPYGSSSCAAVMKPGDTVARKLGPAIRPVGSEGHRAYGWIGGLHLLPAEDGGWWATLGGSPTPPVSIEESEHMREPAPAQTGWAYTPEAWPVSGWTVREKPIKSVDELEPEALAEGEGHNLWRHHALIDGEGKRLAIYYNTGAYGQERLFGRHADLR